MVEAPSIDAFRSALAPVEALRGEQSQLESWVRESFATLETLHNDLEEWQRELTRQQASLDQRQAAVADAESGHSANSSAGGCEGNGAELAMLQERLTQSQEEARQLEEENAEQLQTLDAMERQLAAAQAESRALRMHADELSIALDAERQRAADEQRLWGGEMRDMRRILLQQSVMLISLGATPPPDGDEGDAANAACTNGDDAAEGESPAANHPAARAAELRRRANSRRAQRQPN